MIAFKGFSHDMTARLGKGTYQFRPGRTERTEKSKTAACGFHCCENPLDCLSYYSLGEDRFFLVEAAGSIDEDDQNRIACTEITPLQELNIKQIAGYGMAYMVQHPLRDGWERCGPDATVSQDRAQGAAKILIARGRRPRAMGQEGAVIGLLREPRKGEITAARVFTVTRQQAGKWYALGKNGKIEEDTDAAEENGTDRADTAHT